MNNKKIAAFSLLAHINDNNIGIKNFNDIFIPIVKTSLCKLSQSGIKSGGSLIEIKEKIDSIFALDIPIPILKSLLAEISNEVNDNSKTHFILHNDGSFEMNEFIFSDYEDELEEKETEVESVVKIYNTYLESIGLNIEKEPSIFDYIDSNRLNLSKFFAFQEDNEPEIIYLHQANFINSFKSNNKVYGVLKKIYLGSLIAAYLEVEIGKVEKKIELLLDTNFILGLLDLNSVESTHTCGKISEICDKIGYSKTILAFTIEEIELLIERKAEQLENAFFQGYLDPESIYNAAKRRKLSKTQLLKISNNLVKILSDNNIQIIYQDEKYRKLAKFKYTKIFEFYTSLRGNYNFSALHDSTAIAYVKEKRGGFPIKGDLMKANCWFITNTPYKIQLPEQNSFIPEIIRAEDILNFLWLSNPNVTGFINSGELTSLGLTRLVSTTISNSLPSSKVLKNLDENFNNYGGQEITADDTLMVANMISKKQIIKPDDLNKIALINPDSFILKVKEEAEKGRRKELELKIVLNKILERLETQSLNKIDENSKSEKITDDKFKYFTIFNVLIFLLISYIWWTIDKTFEIDLISKNPNKWILKTLVQLLVFTLLMLFNDVKHRTAWISTSVALLIASLLLLKNENESKKAENPVSIEVPKTDSSKTTFFK